MTLGYLLKNINTNHEYTVYIFEESLNSDIENQIYPINITNEYMRKNIKFTSETYDQYFKLTYFIDYTNYTLANIRGIAIPIEYLFNNFLNNTIISNKMTDYFITVLFKILLNISKITELLIIFSKEINTLYIICTNYNSIVFSITQNTENDLCYKLNNNTFNINNNDIGVSIDTFE